MLRYLKPDIFQTKCTLYRAIKKKIKKKKVRVFILTRKHALFPEHFQVMLRNGKLRSNFPGVPGHEGNIIKCKCWRAVLADKDVTNPICGTQRTTHVSPRIVTFNMTEYNTRDKVFHKSSQQSSSQCDCAWAYHRLMFSHGKIEPRELCLQAWLCLPVELWRLTCLRLHGHHKSNHNVHSFKCLSGFGFVPER